MTIQDKIEIWAGQVGLMLRFRSVPPPPPDKYNDPGTKPPYHYAVTLVVRGHSVQSEYMLGRGHAEIQLQEFFAGKRSWPRSSCFPISRVNPPTRGTTAWQEAVKRFGVPTPSMSQFLECYLTEMQSVVGAICFEEWAVDQGLDPYSRKAETVYSKLLRMKDDLCRLVGLKAFREFVAITEDD